MPRAATLKKKVEGNHPKVLVVHTGGSSNTNPAKGKFTEDCKNNAKLNDPSYKSSDGYKNDYLLLPTNNNNLKKVLYCISEYNPLIDSNNITPAHWTRIAIDIAANYDDFDGFVIIHGSDTMAFTASALSFMFECLRKPIILTGGEVVAHGVTPDITENITTSLLIAGNFNIPEVTICFNRQLFRGNRTTRMSSVGLETFNSFNFPAMVTDLVQTSADVVVPEGDKFSVHRDLNPNVSVLYLFPGITLSTVKALLNPPFEGVVLVTYGIGNISSNRTDVIDEIKKAIGKGVIVVNCSQCQIGATAPLTPSGTLLQNAGVLFCCDVTIEAAITKLMTILSMDLSLKEKKKKLQEPIRGEFCEEIHMWDVYGDTKWKIFRSGEYCDPSCSDPYNTYLKCGCFLVEAPPYWERNDEKWRTVDGPIPWMVLQPGWTTTLDESS